MDIAVSGDYNYSKRIIVSWVFMKYINVQEYYVAYYCKYNENRNSITNPSKVTIEVKTDRALKVRRQLELGEVGTRATEPKWPCRFAAWHAGFGGGI